MEGLKYALLFFGALFLLAWLAGSEKGVGPATGESCVTFVKRIFNQRERPLTASEQADLDLCHKAARDR